MDIYSIYSNLHEKTSKYRKNSNLTLGTSELKKCSDPSIFDSEETP